MTPGRGVNNPAAEGILLKGGNAFLFADREGRLRPEEGHGLYLDDTRHLARYEWSLGGRDLGLRHASNEDLYRASLAFAGEGALSVRRDLAFGGAFLETLSLEGFEDEDDPVEASLALGCDFRDIFEVRGVVPPRGRDVETQVGDLHLTFLYEGRDRVRRWTRVSFYPSPDELGAERALWRLVPSPDARGRVTVKVETGTGPLPRLGGLVLARDLGASLRKTWAERLASWARVEVGDVATGAWLDRATRDAPQLLLTLDGGKAPAAGLPWYVAPFGRDSLLFGLETVHVWPEISQDILRFLAAHQGRRTDPRREEEPGKILHELRRGELAAEGRIPHTPYYGSVDATPLFLCLLDEVRRWTGDRGFCRELYPAAEAAAGHIRANLEASGGFLTYVGGPPPGLRHQGWKDGDHGVLRPDGSQPDPPIALVEAQGYAYWALRALARLARDLGRDGSARELDEEARALQTRFQDAFWMPSGGTYALALEGGDKQVPAATSNPGHLLVSGILPSDAAAAVAHRLLEEDLFTGWGVRTLSTASPLYDPASYHNGSVWPHDTALTAWGMARSGLGDTAIRLFRGLRDAAGRFPLHRLPELFGGQSRGGHDRPVPVPQACPITAWTTGAPLLLLRALAGLEADAVSGLLEVRPRLPAGLAPLRFRGIRVGATRLDVAVPGEGEEVEVRVLEGRPLEIVKG